MRREIVPVELSHAGTCWLLFKLRFKNHRSLPVVFPCQVVEEGLIQELLPVKGKADSPQEQEY